MREALKLKAQTEAKRKRITAGTFEINSDSDDIDN